MNSYLEIQRLIHEMAWMLDTEREEEMIRTLMKDCIHRTPPKYTEMPAIEQAEWAGMAHKRWGPDKKNVTKHLINNLNIEIDEKAGTAKSRCHLTIVQGVREIGFPLQPIFCGTYHDTFKRNECGKWYYATHQLDIDMEGECCNHRNNKHICTTTGQMTQFLAFPATDLFCSTQRARQIWAEVEYRL